LRTVRQTVILIISVRVQNSSSWSTLNR